MRSYKLSQLIILTLCCLGMLPLNGQDTILLTLDTTIIVKIKGVDQDFVEYSPLHSVNQGRTFFIEWNVIEEIRRYDNKKTFSNTNKAQGKPHGPVWALLGISIGYPGGIGPGFGLTYSRKEHMVKLQADLIFEVDLGTAVKELPKENILMTGITYGYHIVNKPSFKVTPSIGLGYYIYNRRGALIRDNRSCTNYLLFNACTGTMKFKKVKESSIGVPIELLFGFYTSERERTRLEFQFKGMLATSESVFNTGVFLHF